MTEPLAEIGIFGGSGFYALEGATETIDIDTPFGRPSALVTIAEIAGRRVAFLPRHGTHHTLPPHKINYCANMWAMHSLGVTRVLGPCACGSLQADIHPGDFVVIDQYVDRTSGRKDTIYDGPEVYHLSSAHPYCPEMREITIGAVRDAGITCHPTGTMVVIQGPRFSTVAESQWFTNMGWHTVSMTQYPEAHLAREFGMCYCCIALVTDYDTGIVAMRHIPPVTSQEVVRVFEQNIHRVQQVVRTVIERMPIVPTCACKAEIEKARIN